jgi:hypothetical protein
VSTDKSQILAYKIKIGYRSTDVNMQLQASGKI